MRRLKVSPIAAPIDGRGDGTLMGFLRLGGQVLKSWPDHGRQHPIPLGGSLGAARAGFFATSLSRSYAESDWQLATRDVGSSTVA
jgi:hypothetical protein